MGNEQFLREIVSQSIFNWRKVSKFRDFSEEDSKSNNKMEQNLFQNVLIISSMLIKTCFNMTLHVFTTLGIHIRYNFYLQ
jgi:hypothetical protein